MAPNARGYPSDEEVQAVARRAVVTGGSMIEVPAGVSVRDFATLVGCYHRHPLRVRFPEGSVFVQSRRSVSEADFPAYWAAHWKAQGYGVVSEHAPDSIPGALAAARARMGALTGERA